MKNALSVQNLTVRYPGTPEICAVDAFSLDLGPGEIVGLIGESGSGKTSVAGAILGVLDAPVVNAESVKLGEQELIGLDERQYRQLRGRDISMVFQEPLTALDPVFTIGSQLRATLVRHGIASRRTAGQAAEKALQGINLGDIPGLLRKYPHQLSGGMRQRIMIAMAMACHPRVLLADEPTTALDVTTQNLVLESLLQLGREHGTAILFITHDLAVAATICDRIAVMKDGQLVETAPTKTLLNEPGHPYTRELLECIPNLKAPAPRTPRKQGRSILRLEQRRITHPVNINGKRRRLTAVKDVSLDIREGEIHALVGESGSGKSTLAQSLVGLKPAAAGSMLFDDQQVSGHGASGWADIRRHVQLVFQDPGSSLSPRRSIAQSLLEPLDHFQIDTPSGRNRRVTAILERVGLDPSISGRYPNELSGGQRQRVALARALISEPRLIVADEPLSSLDVSVQAQIIDLLLELREQSGFTLLMVSHDLAVVQQLADRVSVMYLGRIVESASSQTLFSSPAHPYTRTLLQAIPQPGKVPGRTDRRVTQIYAEPPSLLTPPPGCVFHTRCPDAMSRCSQVEPRESILVSGSAEPESHKVHCLLYENHK